jgi:hypothetical protein
MTLMYIERKQGHSTTFSAWGISTPRRVRTPPLSRTTSAVSHDELITVRPREASASLPCPPAGTKEVPIPTYYLEKASLSSAEKYGAVEGPVLLKGFPRTATSLTHEPWGGTAAGGELCSNIKYLGSGGMEVLGRLTVAYLSQQHTEQDKSTSFTPRLLSTGT